VITATLVLIGVSLIGFSIVSSPPVFLLENKPEAVVLNYYSAIKSKYFEGAYDFISPAMKDGRSREQFAKD
jgi:hypothetical protein